MKTLLYIFLSIFIFTTGTFAISDTHSTEDLRILPEAYKFYRDMEKKLRYLENTNLYRKAQSGDVESMYKLGLIYYYGDGKNYMYDFEDGKDRPITLIRKAFYWFKKAAEAGHVDAIYHLAEINLKNPTNIELRGLGTDQKTGFELMEIAAKRDHVLAQYELSLFYYDLSWDDRDGDDQKKADYWQKKAAKNGHIVSQYEIARKDIDSTDEETREEALESFLHFVYNHRKYKRFAIYAMMHISDYYRRDRFKDNTTQVQVENPNKDLIKMYAWHRLYNFYYSSCDHSEEDRKDFLDDYDHLVTPEEREQGIDLSQELKRDIERKSGDKIKPIKFNSCPT